MLEEVAFGDLNCVYGKRACNVFTPQDISKTAYFMKIVIMKYCPFHQRIL